MPQFLDDLGVCLWGLPDLLSERTSVPSPPPASRNGEPGMEEAHDLYVQFEDGTLARLPSMQEAIRMYQYYEREQIRQREGVKSCWVVRPSDHQVVLGKAPPNWSAEQLSATEPLTC
jgi:hypothetical protein